ncbi:MAG: NADH-quinone oxidoreductase subunit N [Alphaproteobacteria bacterium]|jgi:NADH-quinone oxidoreductase subunit N|nr:NADH-quinone oxidoreductase subunit N [Alphaproteobacteria bacterium]
MINIGSSSFIIAIPEIYLVIVAFLLLLLGLFTKVQDTETKVLLFNRVSSLSVIAIIFGFILVYAIGDMYVETFHSLFIISPIIFLFKLVIIFFVLIIAILSRLYLIDKSIHQFEYIVLMLFFLVGNLLMISSNDFIAFYVTLELTTVCTYILMFMDKKDIPSIQAGIKYFLLGVLGTAFLLYGISLVYGYTGLTNFTEIRSVVDSDTKNWVLLIGIVMILVGIGFKLSLVPFHMWTPDVYKGVNKFVLLMLSVVSKFSIFFILIRILWEPFGGVISQWQQIVVLLIVLSALIGFIVSIYQTNIKSFIAYSSIANMSYMLMIALSPSVIAVKNLIIFSLSYGIALVGFVGTLMLFKRDNKSIVDIYDLKGLYKNHPYLAFILSTFLISMAGLPITAGFFGKIFVLYSVFTSEYYLLGALLALLSVVMMYFYLKVIKIMYFDSYEDVAINFYAIKGNFLAKFTLGFLFLFTVLFIVFLVPLIRVLEEVITFLF